MAPSIASHRAPVPVVADLFDPPPCTGMPDNSGAAPEWTDEEIVFLHWRLLQEVPDLAVPTVPLDSKLATLRWIFTDADKDQEPFSFASCLRVVGCSPLSPIAYCGLVDCEVIRDHIACHVKRWLSETLERYPAWVKDALKHDPEWFEATLAKNPQWINEQIKRSNEQDSLLA
ncbi:MAG: hypothetical protein QM740_20495 [Acidovorax sp.]